MGILHRLKIIAGLAAFAATVLTLPAQAQTPPVATETCPLDAVDVRGDFGVVRFTVELALTPEDQARGLMFRETMPRFAGMLFVYPRAANVSFWMRNTLIPLDMIFVAEDGTILRVHENAIPLDETPIPAGGPTLAVLEINGGMARKIGIQAGDELRSAALPQDKVTWPCE